MSAVAWQCLPTVACLNERFKPETMDSGQSTFGYAGFGLPGVSQKLPANNYKRFSGKANRNASKKNCSVRVLSSKIRLPKFECREWSFILIPDRSTRLDCHCCCFKSCIDAYSFTALKFMPPVAFFKLLYDFAPMCPFMCFGICSSIRNQICV